MAGLLAERESVGSEIYFTRCRLSIVAISTRMRSNSRTTVCKTIKRMVVSHRNRPQCEKFMLGLSRVCNAAQVNVVNIAANVPQRRLRISVSSRKESYKTEEALRLAR